MNRLAGGLDVDRGGGDRPPDPLGDLERLLGRRLRQQDRKLFPAEARRHVVVTELSPERFRDLLQHRIAGEVTVGVVDVAEEIEVGHDQRQRPFESLRAGKLLRKGCSEVPRVEEAGLGIDARLLLQLRHAERTVNQQQRRHRDGKQPRIQVPEGADADAERREHEVDGQALEREDAQLADRMAVEEVQHRGEQSVVDGHQHHCRGHPGECKPKLVVRNQVRRATHHVEDRPRGEKRERPVADVEGLAVPRVSVLQPFRDVLDEPDRGHELGREQHDSGDQEDDRRVVRLVAGRPHDEKLRDCGRRAEDRERQPAVCANAEVGQQGHRDDGGDAADDEEVDRRP